MDKQKHLVALTWLRGIAAFVVVMSHALNSTVLVYGEGDEPGSYFFLELFNLGHFGVCLFFVLSGCTLYISNGQKLKSLTCFKKFYIKRFLRIWPAYAFSLIIYLCLIKLFNIYYTADKEFWIANFARDFDWHHVLYYLFLIFNFTGPDQLFNLPYWSLPLEFQYYLLFPCCIFFMRNKISSILAPIVFSALLYLCYKLRPFHIDQYAFFRMGYLFFLGVLIGYIYKRKSFAFSPKLVSLITFAMFLICALVYNDWTDFYKNVLFINHKENLYGVASLICVFFVLNMKEVTYNNSFTRFLVQYGEISYSIYLFHMIFIVIAILLIVQFQLYGKSLKLILVLTFGLIGSYYFSLLTYRFIEKPCITLGRRQDNKNNKNI